MAKFIMAWCREHGDLFMCMQGSLAAKEELCTACAIRQEDESK